MPDTAISLLSPGSALTGADLFPTVQSGANKKSTIAAILAYLWGKVGPKQMPVYRSGKWYPGLGSRGLGGASTTTAIAADTLYASPLVIEDSCTITDLAVRIGTAVASTNIKVALYSATGGLPDAFVTEGTAAIDGNSTTAQTATLSAAQAVSPGIWWAVILANGVAQPVTFATGGIGTNIQSLLGHDTSNAAMGSNANCVIRGTNGAHPYASGFPANFPTPQFSTTGPGSPVVAFKVQ